MDIDECQDPVLAGTCVENAECCNLPAHFVCKCKEGFEGDGQKEGAVQQPQLQTFQDVADHTNQVASLNPAESGQEWPVIATTLSKIYS